VCRERGRMARLKRRRSSIVFGGVGAIDVWVRE
jgi:hypothetical protein